MHLYTLVHNRSPRHWAMLILVLGLPMAILGTVLIFDSSDTSPMSERSADVIGVKADAATPKGDGSGAAVSFSKDVLPILSDRCFHCHGPDEADRKVGLRLDLEEWAKEEFDGEAPIMPGDLKNSLAWQRITTTSKRKMMPPPDSHRKPLSDSERQIIKRWIESGAEWGKHWSFEALKRPDIAIDGMHPIDAFVRQRLKEEGMALSEPVEPVTLLRRLAFDLTGMAPTPEQVAAIHINPSDPEVLEQAIDQMFASPHHAERMAMWWLDAARYADSDGFQVDAERQNWPWRDWVIQQFAKNRPYNEFTIDQFAGDLLPNANKETRLATSFHRQHMTNGEGGRDPEESRIDYVIDRINTTGAVWMGLTLGCVQCHTHKFDPISHEDYYSLFAFFDSIDEDGKAGMKAQPYLEYTSPLVKDRIEAMRSFTSQSKAQEAAERKRAEQRFEQWLASFKADSPETYRVWWTLPPSVSSVEGTQFKIEEDATVQAEESVLVQDDYRATLKIPEGINQVTGFRLEVFPHASHVSGRFTRNGNGEFTLTSVLAVGRAKNSPSEQQLEIAHAVADAQGQDPKKTRWDERYGQIGDTLNDDARDGWTTAKVQETGPHQAVFHLAEPWMVEPGDAITIVLRHRSTHGNANIGRFRLALATEQGDVVRKVNGSSPIADLVAHLNADAAEPVGDDLRERLLAQFLLTDPLYQKAKQRTAAASDQLKRLQGEAKPRKVMVLAERNKPRTTYILERGVWDAKGKKVQRGFIPEIFDGPSKQQLTRLDLANWILDHDNPLTARVTINHLWQLMFGQGLVRTPADFGLQGAFPTHPELLDWLAVELIESGWDLRHILRLIVSSDTYRQSSDVTQELLKKDPENKLLARALRQRLPAWMIRDNALQVSGLLNDAVGGPPVKPYQPEGVWAEITMGRFHYIPNVGPAQYRRTIYAFWRRTLAPTFLFDSAQRRVCEVGVSRTNTPLHALTLMNDITMLEASRSLADVAVAYQNSEKADVATTLNQLSMRVLSRELSTTEQTTMKSVYQKALDYFKDHPADAITYAQPGQQPPPDQARAPETAAWMTVSSLFLNLDEAITRE